ncbi:MAG: DNA primase [Chitinophagales bacterium]|nr:DNA primase [Chitinophagales bacterium]
MISRDSIRQIIEAARIEEVVADFVPLKKAGSVLKGNCPFHMEKTPSFVVNPNKNIFKCFGCGKGGDAVKFVMEHEKFTYPEALRFLAQKFNITIVETESSEQDKQAAQEQESIYIVLNYAKKFFQEQLFDTEQGKNIGLSYFKERGFLESTIKSFDLGYAPDSYDAFYNQAIANGHQKERLINAGLIKEKNEKCYDFFRDRVMFPIHNVSGKVIAFGGRILKQNEKAPKYINTPETEVYHKSHIVYGIYQAKNEIRQQEVCYLVEGYTDVISLHQAGIKNVVASSGTALTKEQVLLIKRFTQNITILYDGDNAGIKAALRGLDIVLEQGLNVHLVLLPNGEDPDSFVQTNGLDKTLDYINQNKKDFIFFKSSLLMKEAGNDPIKKSEVIKDIVESIAKIDDNIKRQLYIKECANIVEVTENVLVNETNKIRTSSFKKARQINESEQQSINNYVEIEEDHEQNASQIPKLYYQEKDILRLLVEFADEVYDKEHNVGEHILSELTEVAFKNSMFDKVVQYYIKGYEDGHSFKALNDIAIIDDEDIKQVIVELQSSQYELSENWLKMHDIIVRESNRTYITDVDSVMNRFRFYKLMEAMQVLDQRIKTADENKQVEELYGIQIKKMEYISLKIDLSKKIGTITHPF